MSSTQDFLLYIGAISISYILDQNMVTLSVKSRLKSQNIIMRKQALKLDFYP